MALLFIPTIVNAEVKVLNLKDTLAEKGIEIADENYKETGDQIKIYLFRWSSCSHCYDFLVYLNSIVSEYGHMFKLRSYETITNSDNDAVMKKVKAYFNESTDSGVPFIVIGNKTFTGYSSRKDEDILKAIKEEYESSERFDVFDAMESSQTTTNITSTTTTTTTSKTPETTKKANKVVEYIQNNVIYIAAGIVVIILLVLLFRKGNNRAE